MTHLYKYRIDRRTLYWTALYVVVYIGLGWGLYLLYEGEYLSAWFISCIGALLILMALSIPRKLVLTDEKLEIRCLLDITELQRDEIAGARRVQPDEMKWLVPLFGGCGFFGYYGHFFDLRHFDRILIYASEWRNLVEVMTVYEDRIWVSCQQADELVDLLNAALPAGAEAEA